MAQNSRDFVPPEPADVLLHEQLGPAIFGENMIMNLLDLKRRALKPTGRIVPAVFDLYIEPVALKDEYLIPKIWEIEGLGIDLRFLQSYLPLEKFLGKFHGIRSVKNFEVDHLLCEPAPILTIDLNAMDRRAGHRAAPHRLQARRSATEAWTASASTSVGRFDNGTSFDNAPHSPQTNWDNIILRRPRASVARGERLELHHPPRGYRAAADLGNHRGLASRRLGSCPAP